MVPNRVKPSFNLLITKYDFAWYFPGTHTTWWPTERVILGRQQRSPREVLYINVTLAVIPLQRERGWNYTFCHSMRTSRPTNASTLTALTRLGKSKYRSVYFCINIQNFNSAAKDSYNSFWNVQDQRTYLV